MTIEPGMPIATRTDFHAALRDAFARAADAGCLELRLADDDFADWPLGERRVVEQLERWASSKRRMTLLARRFDEVVRHHPRWVAWRQTWSHIVSCRTLDELEGGELPTMLIASGTVTVQLADPVHHRGRVSHESGDEVACRELFDALLQRSVEAFPATTSGL